VRLLSWNILQGGGSREKEIARAIADFKPDIVTLQEFRPAAIHIIDTLKRLGLRFMHVPDTDNSSQNTILIASRFGFDAGDFMPQEISPLPILEASFNAEMLGFELSLLAVHFPQKEPQVPLFKQLVHDTPSLLAGDTILIGDLNCGIPFADSMTKSFDNTNYFLEMLSKGWIDSWRSRHADVVEYTWVSSVRKHGFRYDHALSSKSFDKRISSIHYDHTVREQGSSDHSALIVDFS
jgi:exonuclease III